MKSNFHTHCKYCDGAGELEDYVLTAIDKGFTQLGFSSHAPVSFYTAWNMKEENIQDYFREIDKLKEKYKNTIEIYKGLEIDYLAEDKRDVFNRYDLEYSIGSVHMVSNLSGNKHYNVDGNESEFIETLEECFNGDIQKYVKDYYGLIGAMVQNCRVDVVGHLDVIKKNNRNNKFFNEREQWYINYVNHVLDVIADKGVILEINTGGIARGYISDAYPSVWILKECRKRNIPIMLNSDAHSVNNLACYFDESIDILTECGYFEQKILMGGKWQMVKLK